MATDFNNPLAFDYTAAKVQRGSLRNARTGSGLLFSLNPSSIKVDLGVNLAEDMIPGGSDPLVRWMSGKGQVFSFDLISDGECVLRTLGRQFPNGSNVLEGDKAPPSTWGTGASKVEALDPASYNIQGILEFLDSFMCPVDPETLGAFAEPDKVIFSFGSYFRRVTCVFADLNHNITQFDPELGPVKATSSIKLRVWETSTTFAHEVWTPTGGSR